MRLAIISSLVFFAALNSGASANGESGRSGPAHQASVGAKAGMAASLTVGEGWEAQGGSTTGDGWRLVARANYTAGIGAVAGMKGSQALWLQRAGGDRRFYPGYLRRDIPLQAWRGQRMRVTLRLKNDGDARAYASVAVVENVSHGLLSGGQGNVPGDGWQTHEFVVDVPDHATRLNINVGFSGAGKVWLDDLTLTAVGPQTPVNVERHFLESMQVPY